MLQRIAEVRAQIPAADIDDKHAAENYARGALDNASQNASRGDYSAAWLAASYAARLVAHLTGVCEDAASLVADLRPLAEAEWTAQDAVAA